MSTVGRGVHKLRRVAYRLTRTRSELARMRSDPDPFTRSVGAAIEDTLSQRLDPEESAWVRRIEALRGRLLESRELVDPSQAENVGELCKAASKTALWTLLLFELIRHREPTVCLELGTCLGISASYEAAALALGGDGQLITIEGSPARARLAEENLRSLELSNVEIRTGKFAEVLPGVLERTPRIDFAFIDGHHHEKSTEDYFERLIPHLSPGAVVVFDDISWSPGMARAWGRIRTRQQLSASIDLFLLGVCVWKGESGSPRQYTVALG